MRRYPTSNVHAVWGDPFRLVLVVSLVALVAWVAVHSGAQGATTSRVRTGDVDPGETSSIVLSVADDSPFDLPLDNVEFAPRVSTIEASSDTASRTGSAGRAATGQGGSERTTSGTGGRTTSPPAGTGGTDDSGTAPAPDPGPATTPGNDGGVGAVVNPGGTGAPGNSGTPGTPAVELPVPALPVTPGAPLGGGGPSLVPDAPLLLHSITEPLVPPVVEPLVDPVIGLLG